MNARIVGTFSLAALIVAVAAAALAPHAHSQMQVVSYVPIGVSASGGTSTVWFHEPSARQAVACQAVMQGGALSGVQCVTGKLP